MNVEPMLAGGQIADLPGDFQILSDLGQTQRSSRFIPFGGDHYGDAELRHFQFVGMLVVFIGGQSQPAAEGEGGTDQKGAKQMHVFKLR